MLRLNYWLWKRIKINNIDSVNKWTDKVLYKVFPFQWHKIRKLINVSKIFEIFVYSNKMYEGIIDDSKIQKIEIIKFE